VLLAWAIAGISSRSPFFGSILAATFRGQVLVPRAYGRAETGFLTGRRGWAVLVAGARSPFIGLPRHERALSIFVTGVGDIGVAEPLVSFINLSLDRLDVRSRRGPAGLNLQRGSAPLRGGVGRGRRLLLIPLPPLPGLPSGGAATSPPDAVGTSLPSSLRPQPGHHLAPPTYGRQGVPGSAAWTVTPGPQRLLPPAACRSSPSGRRQVGAETL